MQTRKKKFHQGKYIPKHPDKYVGDKTNIVYRSSWEKKLFLFLDNNSNVLHWASEPFSIPYYSQIDQKIRRYFPDFLIEYIDKNNNIRKMLIEVKPSKETKPPRKRKNQKSYLYEVATYQKNQDKWKAAKEFCDKNGLEFKIMTEKELGIK